MTIRAADLLMLVNKHGKQLTIKQTPSTETYNPANGSLTGISPDPITFKGYIYNDLTQVITKSDIVEGKRKCWIPVSNLGFTPSEGDLISGQGPDAYIVRVITMHSAGVPLVYICELSR